MANQVKVLPDFFGLLDKVIAYVRTKAQNLSSLTLMLVSVVICSPFQLATPFVRSCFGHVMSKACQYALDDFKVRVH